MSTNPRMWPSPKLVLYGIVFRFLCGVALRAGERVPIGAPRAPDPCRSPLRKEHSPLPLQLDPGQ